MKNDHGLFVNDDGSAVGYLFDFIGHGIYSPDGKVEITKQEADTHNQLLSQAEVLGLDNCGIGQRGTFYLKDTKAVSSQGWTGHKYTVTTWIGTVVSDRVIINGKVITFYYGGNKQFRGRLQKDSDCFYFRRIK